MDDFVGRKAELRVLMSSLDLMRSGRGGLVLIAGESGIGKTRLAEELSGRARSWGSESVWGRCVELEGAPPYWPWRQAIRDLPEPQGEDSEGRFRFFETVTELLRSEAERSPLMLVLDDLQAADEDSLLLLEFVASEVAEMPALIVALAREDARRLDELARFATRTLQLGS